MVVLKLLSIFMKNVMQMLKQKTIMEILQYYLLHEVVILKLLSIFVKRVMQK